MKVFSTLALLGTLFSPVLAQPIQLLTEHAPPAQFVGPDGKVTGVGVELVREIQKRVGSKDEIQMVPWARGYAQILKGPNTALFTMTRTPERNALFHWVGPLMEEVSGLYARADSSVKASSLDEARALGRIGVYRNDVREQVLTSMGFTNLDASNDNETDIRKLMAGRVDAIAASGWSIGSDTVVAGFKPTDLKRILVLFRGQGYVAMSKDIDPSVVAAWNVALESMRKDGTLLKILRKYIPTAELPGPAVTAF